jgi:hypothetical protein
MIFVELNDDVNNIIYNYILNDIEINICFLEYILSNIKIKYTNTNINMKLSKSYKLFQAKPRIFTSNRLFK